MGAFGCVREGERKKVVAIVSPHALGPLANWCLCVDVLNQSFKPPGYEWIRLHEDDIPDEAPEMG